MEVEVLKRRYPGTILPDLSTMAPPAPRRVLLQDAELARQMGVPKQFIVELMFHRLAHAVTPGEMALGFGLCAEEIAAFTIAGHITTKFNRNREWCARFTEALMDAVHRCPPSHRLLAITVADNNRLRTMIRSGQGPIEISPAPVGQVTYYDVTRLAHVVNEALDSSPLKLPQAGACVVPN